MCDTKLIELINMQINKELESAYLYLGCANYFKERGLNGFAHWYTVQFYEELEHAEKFMNYLTDNQCAIHLEDIRAIDCNFEEDMEVLAKGLQHEKYVTALINNIYNAALEKGDLRLQNFLDWFISEQAEEEKNAQGLIDMYNNFGCESCGGLFDIDRQLGERN